MIQISFNPYLIRLINSPWVKIVYYLQKGYCSNYVPLKSQMAYPILNMDKSILAKGNGLLIW